MSDEYWTEVFLEIADQNNIDLSVVDINEIAKSLSMASNIKGEMCGDVGHFIDSKPDNNEYKERCERLESIIERLGRRFGVGMDIYREEINHMVPLGAHHMSSQNEKI